MQKYHPKRWYFCGRIERSNKCYTGIGVKYTSVEGREKEIKPTPLNFITHYQH